MSGKYHYLLYSAAGYIVYQVALFSLRINGRGHGEGKKRV